MNFAVALRESGTYFGTPKRCATRTAICNAEHQDHARLLRHELRQQPDGEGGGGERRFAAKPSSLITCRDHFFSFHHGHRSRSSGSVG